MLSKHNSCFLRISGINLLITIFSNIFLYTSCSPLYNLRSPFTQSVTAFSASQQSYSLPPPLLKDRAIPSITFMYLLFSIMADLLLGKHPPEEKKNQKGIAR